MNSPASPRMLRYAIIGAGMSGILAAKRLLERGEREVTVFEKADRVGGTWRENRYPGLTCDVMAHAYTYSFAPNPDWSAVMAGGAEIREYFEAVWRRHGIDRITRFGAEVTTLEWRDGCWALEASDGTRGEFEVVIVASGVLHHPSVPDLPGLDTFAGPSFHTARWPGELTLEGRSVGIIGNGSTGVQIVSALAGRCRLTQFQRTPQWIMKIDNRAFSAEERAHFRAHPEVVEAIRQDPEYVRLVKRFNDAIVNPDSPEMAEIEAAALQYLETAVVDPVLRAKLRPDYRAACKRLIYSCDYYEAVQRPGTSVVREAIRAIEPAGVRTADGVLHELDILVLATGFHADRFIRPTRVTGRGGVTLDERWAVRPSAYLAVTLPDFPNLFLLNGPTGPVGNFSLIDIAEAQWGYIDQLIDELRAGQCRAISPTAAAMTDYDRRRVEAARKTIFASGCRSWYLDGEGVPSTWPWVYSAFFAAMAKPDPAAYERA
ncbi:MAG: flavin-containing monooxygenase [Gammaproteobacteria bacterium]